MIVRVSRRNRRTAPPKTTPIAYRVILAISLIAFIGGFADMAWAVVAHSNQAAVPTQSEQTQPDSSSTQISPYNGRITPDGQSASASTSASSSTSTSASTAASAATSTSAAASASTEVNAETAAEQARPKTDEQSPETSDDGNTQQGDTQGYYVVHHTAYQEIPLYRIVHHQASTPQEVTIGGVTHVEWTSCPVCGQRHESAFNEQIVDHVNEVFCTACGGKHDYSYDEIVWY